MAQVFGALALLGLYFAAAFLILLLSPGLTSLPEIAAICHISDLSAEACHTIATGVAAQGLVAIGMVFVVTYGFARKSAQDGFAASALEPLEASPELTALLLGAIAAVLIVHNIRHEVVGLGGQHYRPAESALVSLESLAWPLLLQLVLWSRRIHLRFVLVGFLAAIAAISPFRNTIFSMLYFGFLIPLGTILVGHSLSRRNKLIRFAAVGTLLLLVLLIVLYQTGRRFEHAEYEVSSDQSRVAVIERGLTSRALTPFFQAALVDRLVQSQQPLPSFLTSIAQKIHLGYQNLNEYVFSVIYNGDGQTTTLYYGESVANTSIPPIFWQFAAPLALVLGYFLLRPICDVGVLIAVALWRSSMGGLFDVVTALSLQLGFCLALTLHGHPEMTRYARYFRLTFAIAVVGFNLAVFTAPLWKSDWELRLNTRRMSHEFDYAYTVPLQTVAHFPFQLVGDSKTELQASSLKLSEDGVTLGPAHSVHAVIRAQGGGRFSHWHRTLYFSSSDGSDPRTNGRQYTATAVPQLPPAVWKIAIALDLLLFVVLFWRPVLSFLTRRSKNPSITPAK